MNSGKDKSKEYILPINKEPNIRAFGKYAFIDMIINNDQTNGDILGIVDLVNENSVDNYCMEPDDKGNLLMDKKVIFNDSKFCFRKLLKNDEYIIQINYQQYTNAWDSIGIFIDNKDAIFEDYSKMKLVFTKYNCEYCSVFCDGEQQIFKQKNEKNLLLKLVVDNNKVSGFVSDNNLVWKKVFCKEVSLDSKVDYIIGVFASFTENQYYKWLYNNFIQLKFDNSGAIKLDYSNFINRNSKNYSIHPFISFSNDSKALFKELGIDIWQYIKGNIKEKRYIQVWLNEKFIEGLVAYNRFDFYHESLVYGVNEEKNTLFLVSFLKGKPYFHEIPFSIFEMAFNACDLNDYITTFEYSYCDEGYELDLNNIKNQLRSYVNGSNYSAYYSNVVNKENGVFGIAIYDYIVQNENVKNNFMMDYRIAYVMYEHKKCMLERVKYLNQRKNINSYMCEEIVFNISETVELTNKILHLVIKSHFSNDSQIIHKIEKNLKQVKEIEKNIYPMLIDAIIE